MALGCREVTFGDREVAPRHKEIVPGYRGVTLACRGVSPRHRVVALGAGHSPGWGSGFQSSRPSPQCLSSSSSSPGDRDRVRGWPDLPRPLSWPSLAPQWEENPAGRKAGGQRGETPGHKAQPAVGCHQGSRAGCGVMLCCAETSHPNPTSSKMGVPKTHLGHLHPPPPPLPCSEKAPGTWVSLHPPCPVRAVG